jgi:hypothetical protein
LENPINRLDGRTTLVNGLFYYDVENQRNMRFRMMRFKVFLTLSLFCLPVNSALAAIVGYAFTATTLSVLNSPYGMAITSGMPVTGQFLYDTSTAASSTAGNLSIYPQNIPNGLIANFGSFPVSASSYTIHVRNDQSQGASSDDFFTIEWASNDTPLPSLPLVANGNNQTAGLFSVNLVYSTNPFSDTSLPATLPTSGFLPGPFSFLSQQLAPIDVPFSVTSLTPLPEPASLALAISGLMLLGIGCLRKHRHNYGRLE